MWTYYLLTAPKDAWALYRNDGGENPQMFRRSLRAWIVHEKLLLDIRKGEIGRDDIVSEDKARSLVESVGGTL